MNGRKSRSSLHRLLLIGCWALLLVAGVGQSVAAQGPSTGAGNATNLEDDYGTYRVIPMARVLCNVNNPAAGKILTALPVVSMTVDQKVAWVLPQRDPDDPSGTNGDYRWAIQGASSTPAGLEPFGAGALYIDAAGDNAYFTAKPVIPSTVTCNTQPDGYCEWKYDIAVAKKVNGVWKKCAELDPRIRIKD